MSHRFGWVAALALAAAVGIVGYNIGISHGIAVAAPTAAAAGALPYPYPPYYWYRPWGFGVGPLFILLLIFFLFRPLLWGGLYRRRWAHAGRDGAPARFDEWHRRAHAQMSGADASSSSSPASGA